MIEYRTARVKYKNTGSRELPISLVNGQWSSETNF